MSTEQSSQFLVEPKPPFSPDAFVDRGVNEHFDTFNEFLIILDFYQAWDDEVSNSREVFFDTFDLLEKGDKTEAVDIDFINHFKTIAKKTAYVVANIEVDQPDTTPSDPQKRERDITFHASKFLSQELPSLAKPPSFHPIFFEDDNEANRGIPAVFGAGTVEKYGLKNENKPLFYVPDRTLRVLKVLDINYTEIQPQKQ